MKTKAQRHLEDYIIKGQIEYCKHGYVWFTCCNEDVLNYYPEYKEYRPTTPEEVEAFLVVAARQDRINAIYRSGKVA